MNAWKLAAFCAPVLLVLAACNQQQPTPAAPGAPGTPGINAPTSGASGGLTGSDRSSFVDSAIASCSAKQQGDPANQGIPMSTITAFCTCYSNQMADKISPSELPSLTTADATQVQRMLQPRIDEATRVCAAQVRGNNGGNPGGNAPAPDKQ